MTDGGALAAHGSRPGGGARTSWWNQGHVTAARREPPPSVSGPGRAALKRFLFRSESSRSRKRPARSRTQLAQTEGFFFFTRVIMFL